MRPEIVCPCPTFEADKSVDTLWILPEEMYGAFFDQLCRH